MEVKQLNFLFVIKKKLKSKCKKRKRAGKTNANSCNKLHALTMN